MQSDMLASTVFPTSSASRSMPQYVEKCKPFCVVKLSDGQSVGESRDFRDAIEKELNYCLSSCFDLG